MPQTQPESTPAALPLQAQAEAAWREFTGGIEGGDSYRRSFIAGYKVRARVACHPNTTQRLVIVGSLANTLEKPGQGTTSIAADGKPACSRHGAMNKVSGERDWWRCLMCNIGVECARPPAAGETR